MSDLSGFAATLEAGSQANHRETDQVGGVGESMAEWALLAPEPKVGPLDFENFPYQVELYSQEVAEAEEVVFLKATQVGQSAWAWRWAMRRAQQFGDTALYIFPTADHVADFGDARIEPAIEASDFLKSQIQPGYVRQKGMKRIGRGWLILRGSSSQAGAQSVDADSVVFDEYSELSVSNVPQIERRLSGARQAGRTPRVRRIGIPRGPGEGIDTVWSSSDQRKWHVTCPDCELEQALDWWKNVRWTCPREEGVMRPGADRYQQRDEVLDAWRVCRACEASLEGDPIHDGRWLATRPEMDLMGYHVQRLIVPLCDLKQMVKASRQTRPSEVLAFFNNDLGEPYSPAESALDEATIMAACALGREATQNVRYEEGIYRTAGIDVASERELNVRVSELRPEARVALWIGTVASFEELEALLRRMRVHLFAIDANPERRSARGLLAKFPGQGTLVEYGGPSEPTLRIKPDDNIVRVNRTEAIDSTMDSIRLLRNWPLREPPPGYVEQLLAPRRKATVNPRTEQAVRTYVSQGPDDYLHAECFDLIAADLLRSRLRAGELVDERPVSYEEIGIERVVLDDWSLRGLGLNDVGYDPGFSEPDPFW